MNKILIPLLLTVCIAATAQAQVTTIATLPGGTPIGTALKGSDLYVSALVGNKIVKIDLTQPFPVTPTTVLANITSPTGLLVIGDYLYFNTEGNIPGFPGARSARINLSSPTPSIEQVLTNTIDDAQAYARVGDTLYISSANNGIFRVNLSQPFPQAGVQVTTEKCSGLALRGNDLYYGLYSGDKVSKINRFQSNPSPVTVATGLAGPDGLTFSGNFLYVSESAGSRIVKFDVTQANIERVGRIVIRTKTGRAKTIVVVQKGLQIPYFEYSIDTLYLPGYQGGDTLAASIYANDDYTLKNLSPGWLWSVIGLKEDSLTTSTEPCSDHLYFRYADNIGAPPRQTLIEATTNSGIKKILTVIQDGIVAEKTVQNILDNVIIYPNPSSSQFFLSGLPKENGAVNLYSSIGVLLNTIHFNWTNNGIMATPDLPSGIYFIEVKIENTSFVKKGIIQK